ncbi:hypothetical protein [Candidatus Bathycorpusculum sp.]|uniref:hypothetical protein n=1 Tax=Candidatus Bathycorpusculum sp. TaxID=2994959 RepID=UPI00281A0A54|nr:hypothetical protein [Candidatus Termitimicrobium sp.]MCL2686428.1 hypothetical protein [Candidatus Termitimicrobium sp.]
MPFPSVIARIGYPATIHLNTTTTETKTTLNQYLIASFLILHLSTVDPLLYTCLILDRQPKAL